MQFVVGRVVPCRSKACTTRLALVCLRIPIADHLGIPIVVRTKTDRWRAPGLDTSDVAPGSLGLLKNELAAQFPSVSTSRWGKVIPFFSTIFFVSLHLRVGLRCRNRTKTFDLQRSLDDVKLQSKVQIDVTLLRNQNSRAFIGNLQDSNQEVIKVVTIPCHHNITCCRGEKC